MKSITYIIILALLLSSCEKVVDIDVPTSQERLVIEASINWYNGTLGNEQQITLTKTAPFFNTNVPPALNATVTIVDSNNNSFNFIDSNNSGVYKTNTFNPILNETYTLNIIYNNETYTATETLKSVSPIDFIEQNNEGGFSGDEIEIKAYYTDPINEDNYYFYQFDTNIAAIPMLEVYDDEFTNGNQIFAFFTEEDLEPQDELIINHFGISEQFYEYMNLLLQQSNSDNGGPFQTQPATVRGNCINITNSDNFPFGYFRLSQAYITNYIVE
ncbi:DUF4249 family protein [Aurantibacter sp.]|uniref:DUF4249 family protein n=1 Tax=Aurantibacter sp. TaxID=2807103 RepID=UPI0035C80F79